MNLYSPSDAEIDLELRKIAAQCDAEDERERQERERQRAKLAKPVPPKVSGRTVIKWILFWLFIAGILIYTIVGD